MTNRWIDVEYEEPICECWALDINNEVYMGYLFKDNTGNWFCETENNIVPNITHWLPIPEPPER